MSTSVTAPVAPGKLGEAIDPNQALTYLQGLGDWITGRRRELAELDAAVLASSEADRLTPDVRLGLSVWQAVKNRYDLLLATWDSGRVGPTERERLSSLIWGRLDTTLDAAGTGAALSGMTVSLPEACRLSDALVSQLRNRLQLDPSGSAIVARIRDLRAQMERLRDQVALEPPAEDKPRRRLAELIARVESMAEKAGRGGDVGGLIGPIEIEAATFERDLIVGGVERRKNRDALERARELRADLEAREQAMHKLVAQTVAAVAPAPKYAVPDVAALGPIPNTAAALNGYLTRLDQVSRAMQVVQSSYSKALDEQHASAGLLEALRAKARQLGVRDPGLDRLLDVTSDVLARRPCPMVVVSPLLDAARRWLELFEEGRR